MNRSTLLICYFPLVEREYNQYDCPGILENQVPSFILRNLIEGVGGSVGFSANVSAWWSPRGFAPRAKTRASACKVENSYCKSGN